MTGSESLLQQLLTLLEIEASPDLQAQSALATNQSGPKAVELPNDVDFRQVIRTLLDGLENSNDQEMQKKSASALASLEDIIVDNDCKTTALREGALKSLVFGMVEVSNHDVNEHCAAVLGNLSCDADDDIFTEMTDYPDLLPNLVMAMGRDDNPALQVQAAWVVCDLQTNRTGSKIVDCPGLLDALVVGLEKYQNPVLQENSAWALANLANIDDYTRSRIVMSEKALRKLVLGMVEVDNRQVNQHCTTALGNLSCGGDDIKAKMVYFPNLLSSLVTIMGKGEYPALQLHAARLVCNLGTSSIGSKVVDCPGLVHAMLAVGNMAVGGDEIKGKMLDIPYLLPSLMRAMRRHEALSLQETAARAVCTLTTWTEAGSKIVDCPGLIYALYTGLEVSKNQKFQEICARALANLGNISYARRIIVVYGGLRELVLVMVEVDNPEVNQCCAMALANLACGGNEIKAKMVDFPNLLPSLVTTMGRDDSPALQSHSARVVRNLASSSTGSRILDCQGLLDALLAGLGNSENQEFQKASASALANLGDTNDDVRCRIVVFEEALRKLVFAMVEVPNYEVNEQCATALGNLAYGGDDIIIKMVDFADVLPKLVTTLGRSDYPSLQTEATRVVINLTRLPTGSKIAECPGLLDALLAGLEDSTNQKLQEYSAQVFSKLSDFNDHTRCKVLLLQGALRKLVSAMVEGQNHLVNQVCATALGNLASGGADIVNKMVDFPDLLQNCMTAMGRDDSPDLQVKAAHLLSNLASKGTEVNGKITAFDGMLRSLVSMVAVDNNELSKQCASTLANLASGGYDIATSMIEFTDLLENLLTAMEKDECPVLQQQAARAVCEMSSNGSGSMILDNSKVLHTLVAGLENSKNRGLQMLSAHALRTLADISDECKWKIVGAEGLLQTLVSAMVYVENDVVNILCAAGMANLAEGGEEVLEKMVNFPNLLPNLVTTMGRDESPALQSQSARVVRNLASSSTGSRIVDCEGLVHALLAGLGNSENQQFQVACASALANLGDTNDDVRCRIVVFEEALRKLVFSMVEVGNHDVSQECAAALGNLANGGDDITTKMVDFPDVLPKLVITLGRSDYPSLQVEATRVVGHLIRLPTGPKIVECPGLLDALLTGLEDSENQKLQEFSAWVFSCLSDVNDHTRCKILLFQRALRTLESGMVEVDNHLVNEDCATALGNLASGGGDPVSKMVDFPDLLQNSMTAMERDDSPDLQVKEARLLSNLATEVKGKITAVDGILRSLVSMIVVNNHELSKQCTCALANLASGGYDIKMFMIQFPDLLQNLLTAMEKDDCPVVQEHADRAVFYMLEYGIGSIILNNSNVLHTLATGLEMTKNRDVQMLSAQALCFLAESNDECRWMLVDAEGVLQKLVSAMVYVDNDLVNKLCGGILCLTKGGEEVVKQMVVSVPEILDVLTEAVAKGESHDGLIALTVSGMGALTVLSPVKAREMHPVSAVMYFGRARGELLLGRYKECLDDLVRYEAGICGTPAWKSDGYDEHRYYKGAQSWKLYAKAKLGDLQGSLADADSLLQFAISTGSDSRSVLQERGVVRRMMGDLSGALEDLNASLGSEEEDVYEVLKHRGLVKYLMKDNEGAIADGERAFNCAHSRIWDVSYGRECLSTDPVEYFDFCLL